MKSPNISTPANPFNRKAELKGPPCLTRGTLVNGFTLIETLIVIGLIGFVAVVGVIVGLDTYQRYVFRSDLDKTVALLQKARSSAINNVDEKSYGVYFGDSSEPNITLFRGTTYVAGDPYNYSVAKSRT